MANFLSKKISDTVGRFLPHPGSDTAQTTQDTSEPTKTGEGKPDTTREEPHFGGYNPDYNPDQMRTSGAFLQAGKTPPQEGNEADVRETARQASQQVAQMGGMPAPNQTNEQRQKKAEIEQKLKDIKSKVQNLKGEVQKKKEGKEEDSGVTTQDELAGDTTRYDTGSVKESVDGASDSIDDGLANAEMTMSQVDSYSDLMARYQTELEKTREARKKAEKRRGKIWQRFMTQTEERKDIATVRKEAREKYGIPKSFEKIKTLKDEMVPLQQKAADLRTEMNDRLTGAEEQGMPKTYIRGEKARIQRRYENKLSNVTSKMQLKATRIEALQGNLNRAESYVQNAVSDFMYETKMNRQDMQTFLNYYGDQIDNLDQDEQNYLSSLQNYWTTKAEWERQDYKDKLQLVVSAANEGINFDPTAEQIKNMPYSEFVEMYSRSGGKQLGVVSAGGETFNLTSMAGLERFRERGGTVAQARQVLDQIEGYSQTTIDTMLKEAEFEGTISYERAKAKASSSLEGHEGEDGYVRPGDWRAARRRWENYGFTTEEFVREFSDYINPADPQDYGKVEQQITEEGRALPGGRRIDEQLVIDMVAGGSWDTLDGLAEEEGYGDPQDYLNSLMSQVEIYRNMNKTEEEILELIT